MSDPFISSQEMGVTEPDLNNENYHYHGGMAGWRDRPGGEKHSLTYPRSKAETIAIDEGLRD